MQLVNAPQILEELKETAERFLAVYPDICKMVAGGFSQPAIEDKDSFIIIPENPEQRISQLLQGLGIPMHIKGFLYIKTAIKLLQSNESLLFAVTKELYPTIAEAHATTDSRVERAIRHAIEKAANTPGDFAKRFMHCYNGKPTNSEFLAWCIETLKFQK